MRTLSIKQLSNKSNNKSTSEKENRDAMQFYWVYKKSILRYSDTVDNRRERYQNSESKESTKVTFKIIASLC